MSVLCGVDVLVRDGFAPLRGQRVGLVTNHTGLTCDLRSTIDVLHAAPGVKLVALFGPEHGLRGDRDEKVADGKDEATGLPVYSLYGQSFRPKPEALRDLDALVFDIQDIGCRFYTYISTMGHCMEACAEVGIHFVVLDRPNPITGTRVEGPTADQDSLSFTAWHPIPVQHGMTVGELARMFNEERRIGAGLIVIPCEGWRRSDWFDATGLTWTNPSPNMRCLNQATLYPGIGLLETTNVSVGRGTDTPFEHFGAPWMDGRRVASALNEIGLPGVRFVPVRFVPDASVFKGASCGGVNVVITNRSQFRAVRTGLEIAGVLLAVHRSEWSFDRYNRLLVHRATMEALRRGDRPADIERGWASGLRRFGRIRSSYLLYR
ncbi:MAG: DUF1343 domain-containing protein [Chthonomonadales bacterium]|nr:DUF1343 domain-containing protein [Chthonomonadales bacterium]